MWRGEVVRVRNPNPTLFPLIFRFSSIEDCELQCRVEDPQPRALDETLDSLGKAINTNISCSLELRKTKYVIFLFIFAFKTFEPIKMGRLSNDSMTRLVCFLRKEV